MNTTQLRKLLVVTQINDYTWRATMPELLMMWQTGFSEEEAQENWLKAYGDPSLYPVFMSVAQERAKHPPALNGLSTRRIQRPATVDFPYRGRLYRFATNEGLPKQHIVLPDGKVLLVSKWTGRVPKFLADIRRSADEPMMSPQVIATALDGVVATEIPLPPGQTTKPMAILDYEGQRYAVDLDTRTEDSNTRPELIEFPDGRLCRIATIYDDEEPVRIAEIRFINKVTDAHWKYQLETFGKTPAIPMPSAYPGMPHEPWDIRICFTYQGESYVLSDEAYKRKQGIVFLPDRGYFRILSYLESLPVKIGGLEPLGPVAPTEDQDIAVALRLCDAIDVLPMRDEA